MRMQATLVQFWRLGHVVDRVVIRVAIFEVFAFGTQCCDEGQVPLHDEPPHFGFGAQSELVVVPAVTVEPLTSRPIAMPPQFACTLGGVSSGDFASGDLPGGKK